ncbi:Uncharacterised protein [Mycobacteroides abscessus subsp. abscessus]|nr:Uncharacterised protein [Mycobacteroides abscessus subsp. abscessus]
MIRRGAGANEATKMSDSGRATNSVLCRLSVMRCWPIRSVSGFQTTVNTVTRRLAAISAATVGNSGKSCWEKGSAKTSMLPPASNPGSPGGTDSRCMARWPVRAALAAASRMLLSSVPPSPAPKTAPSASTSMAVPTGSRSPPAARTTVARPPVRPEYHTRKRSSTMSRMQFSTPLSVRWPGNRDRLQSPDRRT